MASVTYDASGAVYLRAGKAALTSFEEDFLTDPFEQVCDVVEPGAENPRKRATHAIQRLREHRRLQFTPVMAKRIWAIEARGSGGYG